MKRRRYTLVVCDGKGNWRIEPVYTYTRQGVWIGRNDRRLTPEEIEVVKARRR